MGRSPASSCLRLISCSGGDDTSADPNSTALENKSSGDKRGWSFRKKSGKQRGLITSVVSETTPASRTRETLESALLKSPSPDNNNVSEKQQQSFSVDEKKSQLPVVTYVAEPVDEKKTQSVIEEKTELLSVEEQIDHRTEVSPVIVESKGTETEEDDLIGTELQGPSAADAAKIEEDVTSEVEMASKVEPEESESDDVIIVRKESDEKVDEKLDESVIVVIQAAVRGFLARRELLRSKKVIKLQAAVRGHLVRTQAMGSLRCVQAIVKMQAMVRARHSTKDGSRVSATSDKSEPNAAAQKLLENKFAKHLMESTPKTKPINIKCDPTKPSSAWNWLERWMSVPKPEKTSKANLTTEEQNLEETQNVKISPQADFVNSDSTVENKTETDMPSYEASKVEGQNVELSETEKMSQYDSPEASAEVYYDSIQSQPLAAKPDSLLEKPEYVDGQIKHSLKRKVSNPSFIAAQSKFEELTSSTGSNKAMTLSSKDDVLGEEGKTDIDSPDTTNTIKDHSLEDVTPAELSGSECGTELSVTSSLDTLEKKSDAEGAEPRVEAKLLEDDTFKTDQAELIEIDVKDATSMGTVEDPKEKVENAKDEVEISATHHEPVISTPDSKKRRAEDESGPQAYALSEGALTPMTITESQATPASQASSSVKARKGKSEKSGSSQKRKVSKKITSSPKQEIGTGEATEQEEGKEQKSGRRTSFGYDQEARESSGGKNSLPRFMQPTQSAKAKVQEHNSPRSSPDLQERDVVSAKKRHSLPGVTNGKQVSPRIQRSASQAQQGTKDRKWQR
ncbi:IQ motif EF-hand binding site [Arabidopsis suecica]|uniref:IQ motif EF-hand binding site n=1 Tax=Arabidopsis suecica TaxID=45249 RepID=A0A8T2H5T0_ARASU|nr:IQ motif EF-hand binding site [Arabidopsis suecica]